VTTKEEVYDAQIEPLMARVHQICSENNIAFIAVYSLGGDFFGPFILTEKRCEPPIEILKAQNAIAELFLAEVGNDCN